MREGLYDPPHRGRARVHSLAGVACTPHLCHREQTCLCSTITGYVMLTHFAAFCNQYHASALLVPLHAVGMLGPQGYRPRLLSRGGAGAAPVGALRGAPASVAAPAQSSPSLSPLCPLLLTPVTTMT